MVHGTLCKEKRLVLNLLQWKKKILLDKNCFLQINFEFWNTSNFQFRKEIISYQLKGILEYF